MRDGSIAAGQVAIVTRQNRRMTLANGGAAIAVINPSGETADTTTYGPAAVGQLVPFA